MINQRLFDHYGIDTKKNLKIENRCPRPFDTVLIDKQGSCYACECTAWLPQSIGNLQVNSLERIINSETHRHLTGSIDDRSYRYCNEKQCPYIQSNTVGHTDSGVVIKELRLAIDDSCNLRCPSCRNSLVFHKSGSQFDKRIRLADRINDWLAAQSHPLTVHIGSDGDPFASHVYRHFMYNTPTKDNIGYSILTNGLMFEEHHRSVPNVISNLKLLGVSMDGATKDTYEKLRLGGSWDKIQRNLSCMARVKEKHGFWFRFHVVVQQDNWVEMKTFTKLANTYGVDEIYFSKIQDWGTDLDYSVQTFTELPEYRALCREIEAMPGRYVVPGL